MNDKILYVVAGFTLAYSLAVLIATGYLLYAPTKARARLAAARKKARKHTSKHAPAAPAPLLGVVQPPKHSKKGK